jgi:hypothetical protein
VPEAFAVYEQTEQGVTIRAKVRTTIFITPGATFSISCNAVSDKFDTYRTAFAGIVESFRARNEVVAMLSSPRPYGPQQFPLDLKRTTANALIGVNTRRAVMR